MTPAECDDARAGWPDDGARARHQGLDAGPRPVLPHCGFDTAAVASDGAPALVRTIGKDWRDRLTSEPAPARRTRPDRWSLLEYACHVRDVFGLAELRLALMLLR